MKKITVIITNSLGELDVLLPIFSELNETNLFRIKIIFSNKLVFKKFTNEITYVDLCKTLKINICLSPLFNKFDYKLSNKNIIDRIKQRFLKYCIGFVLDLLFVLKNYSIFYSDIIMNDASSNILKNTSLDFLLFKLLKKKNYVYHHGHSLLQIPNFTTRIKINPNATVLSFHESSYSFWKSYNYKKIYNIGFPKFYKNWITLIKNYNKFDIFEKYVLIYSRKIDNNFYMDENIYTYLLTTSYNKIRDIFPNYKIIIKIHPREDKYSINKIIKSKKMTNIEISTVHPVLLAKHAKLIISFWTSAIFDSLSLNIPTIEFYKEAKNFRDIEPKGSLHKTIGLSCASDDNSLVNFLKLIKLNKYKESNTINEIKNFKDLKIFDI